MNFRHHKKVILIIAGVILFIGLGFMLKLFIIGEPVAGEQVHCTTAINGQMLGLQVDTDESAVALRGFRVHQKGGNLYINARKVLVSPFFQDGHYETSINIETIDKIILGGVTIWSSDD